MQRETQTETEMRGEEIRWIPLKIKIKVPRQGTLASSRKYDNIREKKGVMRDLRSAQMITESERIAENGKH